MWWNKKKKFCEVIEVTEGIRLVKEVKFQKGTGLDRGPLEYTRYEIKRVQFYLYENGQTGENEYFSEFTGISDEAEALLIFDYLKKHDGKTTSRTILEDFKIKTN
jgi:hypothetical protein